MPGPSDQSPEPAVARPRKPYVHARWAGGPADVWKQAVLAALIRALPQSTSSLHYIETHAGAGLHRVKPYAAWREGVGAMIEKGVKGQLCRSVADHSAPWLSDRGWQPGSWHFAAAELARRDIYTTMDLWERDPLVYEDACRVAASIENQAKPDSVRIRVHRGDGFAALDIEAAAAALVLIDPPYILDGSGRDGDWEVVARAMAGLAANAALAVAWYPLFGDERAKILVEQSGCEGFELTLGKALRGRDLVSQGSGMLASPAAAALLNQAASELELAAADLKGGFNRRQAKAINPAVS